MLKISVNYQTLLELRIWLKIGLAQEKKGSYDAAAQAYQEAILIAETFFDQAISEATAHKNDTIDYHLENINHFKLLFQPHLCQAYLLEKSAANVHTSFALINSFLKRLRTLLNFDSLKQANFPLFCAECLVKVADLFYYKGFTPYHSQRRQTSSFELQFVDRAEDLYFEAIGLLLKTYFTGEPNAFCNKRYSELLEKLTEIFCLASVRPEAKTTTAPSVQVFQLLANAVSDLSNVLLTKTEAKEIKVPIRALVIFFKSWRTLQKGSRYSFLEFITISKIPGPWNALAMNLLAARIFLWASLHKEAAFEYEKIIQTLRYGNINFPGTKYSDIVEILELLNKEIYNPGRQHYFRAYLNAPTSEIDSVVSRSPNLVSEPPEVENLTLYWLRLQDRFIKKSGHKKIRQEIEIIESIKNISPDDVFDNIKIRIDRLNFKVNKLNDWYQENYGDLSETELKKAIEKTVANPKMKEQLFLTIKDSLFCCYNSIILREIHSNTYWWLHLGRAFMHYFLAQWLQRWQAFSDAISKNSDSNERDTEKEKELMKYLCAHNLQIKQQLQLSLENFHQVKETHTNGRAYKTLIKHLYFLNNDFNDRAYHFHLAHERAQLRRGKVETKMKEVEEQMQGGREKKRMEKFDPPGDSQQMTLPFVILV